MITKEKVEIYKYYKGDVDAFGHGSSSHRKIMSDEDFFLIRDLIQNINIINKNLASKEFIEKIELQLKKVCDNESTIMSLKHYDI